MIIIIIMIIMITIVQVVAASPELWGIFQPYAHLSSCRTAKVSFYHHQHDQENHGYHHDDDMMFLDMMIICTGLTDCAKMPERCNH